MAALLEGTIEDDDDTQETGMICSGGRCGLWWLLLRGYWWRRVFLCQFVFWVLSLLFGVHGVRTSRRTNSGEKSVVAEHVEVEEEEIAVSSE